VDDFASKKMRKNEAWVMENFLPDSVARSEVSNNLGWKNSNIPPLLFYWRSNNVIVTR